MSYIHASDEDLRELLFVIGALARPLAGWLTDLEKIEEDRR